MSEKKEIVRSLHQLTKYPPDLSHPIYKEYPFFKLGVASGVRYFAERLTPFVEDIIASNPQYTSWVLTAPPCRRIPTAANLLSREIYERLKRKNKNGRYLSLVQLYNNREVGSLHENAKAFSNFSGYSGYSWNERMEVIRKNQFSIKEEDFCNRGIVFINDINVTGASQDYISHVFAAIYPGKINWLYIIDCDKTVGRKDPQLENEINNANIKTVADFGAILSRDDIRHTAKCISKIFSYSIAELEQLTAMLDDEQKLRIWNAVQEENLYQSVVFNDKTEWLQTHFLAGAKKH